MKTPSKPMVTTFFGVLAVVVLLIVVLNQTGKPAQKQQWRLDAVQLGDAASRQRDGSEIPFAAQFRISRGYGPEESLSQLQDNHSFRLRGVDGTFYSVVQIDRLVEPTMDGQLLSYVLGIPKGYGSKLEEGILQISSRQNSPEEDSAELPVRLNLPDPVPVKHDFDRQMSLNSSGDLFPGNTDVRRVRVSFGKKPHAVWVLGNEFSLYSKPLQAHFSDAWTLVGPHVSHGSKVLVEVHYLEDKPVSADLAIKGLSLVEWKGKQRKRIDQDQVFSLGNGYLAVVPQQLLTEEDGSSLQLVVYSSNDLFPRTGGRGVDPPRLTATSKNVNRIQVSETNLAGMPIPVQRQVKSAAEPIRIRLEGRLPAVVSKERVLITLKPKFSA